jgi:hypothetical protein
VAAGPVAAGMCHSREGGNPFIQLIHNIIEPLWINWMGSRFRGNDTLPAATGPAATYV